MVDRGHHSSLGILQLIGMTISRRFSSLVYDFLRDAAVIATYNLPNEATMVRRLMDDGLEEARPSLLVAAREDPKNVSARRKILVNVLELVAMKTKDATAALPAQVEPDEASDILVRVNNAIRGGFSDWLALRPDGEREGYALCKLVFTGELQTSRDAEKRTVDYGVEWVFYGYCLT
jgi:hypothetical protein